MTDVIWEELPEEDSAPITRTDERLGSRVQEATDSRNDVLRTLSELGVEQETLPLRPLHRPPTALLCILDDEGEHGEWVRIRTGRLIIGRTQGDVVIPLDSMMSNPHAQITLHQSAGQACWRLTDLESVNGTLVRVNKATLYPNQEVLIGSRRYRFDAGPADAADGQGAAGINSTSRWQDVLESDGAEPALVELTPQGEGERYPLDASENWIGRHAGRCSVVISGDPYVSPEHACLYRDRRGRWRIKNLNSFNGLWLRVQDATMDRTSMFLLGEQRFLLRMT